MSDFGWLMLAFVAICAITKAPEMIAAWRFGGQNVSARQFVNRVKRGEQYTIKHPHGCGCTDDQSTESRHD